jgi:prepilin-type N-terminal cleavage/methylation domain-containing protein
MIQRLPQDTNRRRHNHGFTIVELLVVIVIIGILAAITIVAYTGISQKAVASTLQSDLTNAQNQLRLYYTDYSSYPTTMSSNCPTAPVSDSKYCLKPSGSNIFSYTPGSGTSPQAFSLTEKNGNTYYQITSNSNPTSVTPIANASVSATGSYTVSSDGPYSIYTFTANGSITTTTTGTAEVLVVGGGGGGGSGGGGAGGYLTGMQALSGVMTVTVGAGGPAGGLWAQPVAPGQDSIFGTFTAKGGGFGSEWDHSGGNGGSGGGAGAWTSPNTGGIATPSSQGNSGGNTNGPRGLDNDYPNVAPGGGGAGTAGGNVTTLSFAGNGGQGLNSDIVLRGTNVGYAGGGGGGDTSGGSGGSGIVIIRYLTPW